MTAEQARLQITDYIGERVRDLQEYAPEPLEETARRLGVSPERLIKADANENPYGPLPEVLKAFAAFRQIHQYPDPISRRLAAAISQYIGVPTEHILVGNGSDELIDLILRLFRPGPQGGGIAEVIDCQPTFGMYSFYTTTNDMRVIDTPRTARFEVDIEAIEALCARDPQPRIIYVASPNNPDGQLLPDEILERLLGLPLLVVLDEAYVEFAGGSRVSLVPQRENLIVLRTFSKWAGLAGLRVGYGVFPLSLMPSLWRLKSPYNVNGAAQAAALVTCEHADEALQRVQQIVVDREVLYGRLAAIEGLRVYRSQANYIMCVLERGDLARLRKHMEAQGVMLRYYGRGALERTFRVSVSTGAQNEVIADALETYLAGAPA